MEIEKIEGDERPVKAGSELNGGLGGMKIWLIDVTNDVGKMPCFCPYEELTGMIMTGLNVISARCPGELIGVFHEGGQEAAEKWCGNNPDWHERYA